MSARTFKVSVALGSRRLRQTNTGIVLFVMLAACSRAPRTDQQLISEAEHAADVKLATRARFSAMEATISQKIACGNAAVGGVNRNFVYVEGRVILDDDPDFDTAAIRCDAAIGGNAIAPDSADE